MIMKPGGSNRKIELVIDGKSFISTGYTRDGAHALVKKLRQLLDPGTVGADISLVILKPKVRP